MKTLLKSAAIAAFSALMPFGEFSSLAPLGIGLVPEAHALIGLPFTPLSFAGVARRTAFRSAQWAGAAAADIAAADSVAAANTAGADSAAAHSVPPSPLPSGGTLPLGTVVSSLPSGCTSTPVGGEEYYHCDGDFYRAVFQGSNLVYVTAQP